MKYAIQLFAVALLFTACNQSKEKTVTEEVNIKGSEISYTTDDITMNGYIAYDESSDKKRPGILVVHEWWGHNEYTRKRADMLAELGYVAIAVDMYGNGKQADHPEDAQKFSSNVMGNFEDAKARFNAAIETLKKNPNVDGEKIGAIGYCFGGSVILSMANAGVDLDGVAAFHAGLQLPVMPKDTLRSRVLVMNGADDPFVTQEQIANFTGAMESANSDFQFINYEGAVHAFTNPGATELGEKFELPLAYNAEADSASWQEMKAFFNTTFPNN